MTNASSLRTVLVSMAVGALLAVLALAAATTVSNNREPGKVDQELIVYGER